MTTYLYIDGHKRNLRFSAAHWVENAGKCERIHGHDYYVSVKIYGSVSEDGMIIDFNTVKSALKEILNELDHKLLVPENKVIKKENGFVYIKKDDKTMVIAEEDVAILPVDVVTAEELARYILERLYDSLKEKIYERKINQIEVLVDEGGGQEACFVKKLFV